MLYLLLLIGSSVLIGFLFKLFPRYRVDPLQAIVFNYLTCMVCGFFHLLGVGVPGDMCPDGWVPYAWLLGGIFIAGFYFNAQTVRFFGVAISQIMPRMSILLTVPVAIIIYSESAGWTKLTGLVLALAAIVLVNWPGRKNARPDPERSGPGLRPLWFPALAWLAAGLIETLLLYVRKNDLNCDPAFLVVAFAMAGGIGLLILGFGWITGRRRFSGRNILGGMALGVPNYLSVFSMIGTLDHFQASVAFPVSNISIIILTTIGAVVLFHEKFSRLNWTGIGLAILAILLISL